MNYFKRFLALCLTGAQLFANKGYVTDRASDSVYVFDTTTNAIIGGPIPLPGDPEICDMMFSPDGRFLYISNFSNNSVTIIDTETDSIVVSAVPTGTNPLFLAITPSGERLFVGNTGSNDLTAIIYNGNVISSSLPIEAGTAVRGLAVTPDGTRLYVLNATANTATILDPQTTSILSTINAGTDPFDIVITSSGRTAYITNQTGQTLSVLDTASNTITSTIDVGENLLNVALPPDEGRVYVTLDSGGYRIIYPNTKSISAPFLSSEIGGLSFDPNGTVLYVANSNHVDIISTATNTVTGTLFGGFQITNVIIKGVQTPPSFAGKQKSNTIGIASRPVNKFSWERSGASSLAGYYLRRNGELIATLGASAHSYTDKTFNASQTNVYTLAAFDTQGNIGIAATVTIGRN
jgi:YVTN family beta-propeller protein